MLEVVESTTPELLIEDVAFATVGAAVESATPELLTEDVPSAVVESATETFVVETTASGPDIIVESLLTDVIVDTQTQQVIATEVDTYLVEAAEQGPPGPTGPTGPTGGAAAVYAGRTLVYVLGVLTEVLLYLDAAKTQLAQRRVLSYAGGLLTAITYSDGAGATIKTRSLTYTSGVLTGVTEA